MCGITGFWKPGADVPADGLAATARRMADRIRHRGPDDAGVWVDAASGIAFGHRRLAILDLSADGAQPMVSECGRYVIAYNGETYNFRELGAELRAAGCTLRSRSDTEVVLAAVAHWGIEGALERMNGMWAFALWDVRDRRLTLARDRVGKKPLYYGRSGDTFLFASELKALGGHPDFSPEVDREALALFFRYGWVPGPRSIFRGISKLDPGCVLHLDEHGQRGPESFWSARDVAEACAADPFTGSMDDAVESLDALLRDAVRRRMVSDVPIGALLSGGIDSSTVVALMQQLSDRPVRTFSIGFHEPKFDEAGHATAVARHLGTQHTNLYLTPPEAQDTIAKLPNLYDEPFADVSQIPTHVLARLARRDVTVALSGDGGDELFLGYKRYFLAEKHWKRIQKYPRYARESLARFARIRGRIDWWWTDRSPGWERHGPRPTVSSVARYEKHADRLEAHSAVDLSRIRLGRRAGLDLVLGTHEAASLLSSPEDWASVGDPRREMAALDFVTYLRDDILVKMDRASMGVSLEVRCPLLDRNVVEFAWTLPVQFSVQQGVGKQVLRRVLERYVPDELTSRNKQGFGVPIDDWLRSGLRDWAEALLDEKRLREEGLLHAAAVRRIWAQHLSGWGDHGRLLWSILMYRAWSEARASVFGPPA